MNDQLLRQVPLLASLTTEGLRRLAASAVETNVSAGQILFREGERGDRLYIILGGEVESVKALGTEDERVLGIGGASEFVGEMSLVIPDGLRTASIRARTRARLLEISYKDFDNLLQRQPAIGYSMVKALSGRLSNSNNTIIRDLHAKNLQLTEANQQLQAAYEELKRAQAEMVEKEKLIRELEVAREIQQSILPRQMPCLSGFDFGALMVPTRAVGGDFFDFIPLGEDRLGIAVGDVSDKGVPAALFMALTCSVLRAEASRADSPREALNRVNRHLLAMNDSGMFVTLLFGVLNSQTREFAYVRAGHEFPLVLTAEGELTMPQRRLGQPLGLTPDPRLDEQSMTIPPGGTLIVHTDGITDAMDPHEARFGSAQLQAAIRAECSTPAEAVCDHLLNRVRAYAGPAPQYDDITIVAVHNQP
ncbi:MAG: SpoIIE family protein phosphatase [Chloroflexi bacterium]|nr:SpoIIE family protein phosphatase [Chloroflexota bacterium]MBI3733516.1 SpoIIE family protein phosphatase [Chloroflexota bacterium]